MNHWDVGSLFIYSSKTGSVHAGSLTQSGERHGCPFALAEGIELHWQGRVSADRPGAGSETRVQFLCHAAFCQLLELPHSFQREGKIILLQNTEDRVWVNSAYSTEGNPTVVDVCTIYTRAAMNDR